MAVLRIHLILIRILDPHWKKMDPNPGYFFKINWIILTIFNFFVCNKYSWSIQKSWNIYYLSFFNCSNLGFESKIFAAVVVLGSYFVHWIRIRGSAYFCGSGSMKPNSCGSGAWALVLGFTPTLLFIPHCYGKIVLSPFNPPRSFFCS